MKRFGSLLQIALMLAAGAGLAACGDSGENPSGPDASGVDGPDPTGGLLLTLADGKVQGDLVGGARVFLKIPFAKPPVGDLRWRPPVKNDPWTDVRHESALAEPCPQDASVSSPLSRNEDCLYLNVWSPDPAVKAPVMVWFHGGANITGSAADEDPLAPPTKLYTGEYFAAHDGAVVVTTNYRLGVLGFFAHPALAAEGSPVGNQGLMDQQMVLQWVRDNIAKFGGDPDNVTVFGESAGAIDICYHMVSPLSRGLFHRAIGESGGCTTGLGNGPAPAPAQLATGLETFAHDIVGCGAGADPAQLACLRTKTADELLTAAAPQPDLTAGVVPPEWIFIPVTDGTFLPASPRSLYDAGNIADVPYLLGTNTNEGTLFLLNAYTPDYMAGLEWLYGSACAQKIATCYPLPPSTEPWRAVAVVLGDSHMVCPTRDTALRAAAAGRTVFLYNFNVVPSLLSGLDLGVTHGAELSFVFYDHAFPDPAEEAIADSLNAYWARFAASGNPNGAGAPATWPVFNSGGVGPDVRLQIDSQWQVLTDFHKKQCEFWSQVALDPDCGTVDPSVCN